VGVFAKTRSIPVRRGSSTISLRPCHRIRDVRIKKGRVLLPTSRSRPGAVSFDGDGAMSLVPDAVLPAAYTSIEIEDEKGGRSNREQTVACRQLGRLGRIPG